MAAAEQTELSGPSAWPCAVEPPPSREQEPGLPRGGHGSLGAEGLFLLSLILPAGNRRLGTMLRSEGPEADPRLPAAPRDGGQSCPTPRLGSTELQSSQKLHCPFSEMGPWTQEERGCESPGSPPACKLC